MTVTINGSYGCTGQGYIDVAASLNNYMIDINSVNPSPFVCACGTCDGSVTFLSEQIYGIPGFNLGGENSLSIFSYYDTTCLNTAKITLFYEKNGFSYGSTGVEALVFFGGVALTRTPGQCGVTKVRGINGQQTVEYRFFDPLPSNSKMITVSFNLFGRYFADFFDSGNCTSNASLSIRLGNAPGNFFLVFIKKRVPLKKKKHVKHDF